MSLRYRVHVQQTMQLDYEKTHLNHRKNELNLKFLIYSDFC